MSRRRPSMNLPVVGTSRCDVRLNLRQRLMRIEHRRARISENRLIVSLTRTSQRDVPTIGAMSGSARCDVRRRCAALPTCFRHLLSSVLSAVALAKGEASAKEDAGRSNFPGRRGAPSLPGSGAQGANLVRELFSPHPSPPLPMEERVAEGRVKRRFRVQGLKEPTLSGNFSSH